MNICILTHTFPRNEKDVAAAFMKEFADGLCDNGHKVVVVTPFDSEFARKGDKFKIILYKYIWPDRLHCIGYSKTMDADISLRKKAYFLLPFMLFFGIIALWKAVKKEKIDLINVHWILPNGLIAMCVSILTGVPFVVTLPGTDAYLVYKNQIFAWVAKLIANRSSGIVSNSSVHLKRIMDLGIKKDKLCDVISYPVDVSSLSPNKNGVKELKKKLKILKDEFVILAVGRLVYKKGFEFLIKAMPLILKEHKKVKLIIGGEGDLMNDLKRLVTKLQFEDKVIFVGTIGRNEIGVFYNMADVLVAPSVYDKNGNVDGGPLVSAESMACGKPQILTEILGMADEMRDGVNGFIIKPENQDEIAKAVMKLIKSPKIQQEMGRNNRKLLTARLSTKSIGKRYTRFFEKSITS
ncbi:hypothetical protein A2382_00610 [Candidatus Woesebacteria bacterium RIFOXYB1_FULL_38_16]|uniref:Glycosyl transferase family 1 domain-containing protein n=1 Tax=Candidatus Woesebacteria bacterium RIFOXYB1_FULL_38_16 TaxID=1802538 RepID=A0A1F8CSN6_9BACT|nr:MAG: hypothetical protein A2191_01490 [Candidatus Woesebacteria bacterium RIFOXYA1_FULL_38_9]OGM79271.1 MAG: hypothetical protein A2382_00610 [Candidatus Woesebacteria bacterium RIFOXYB1_FULL_38_16]